MAAFRRHTLLLQNDCLHALRRTIPHLTHSSLHRCQQRRRISRLPNVGGDKPKRQHFKHRPIRLFHIDVIELQMAERRLLVRSIATKRWSFSQRRHRERPLRISGKARSGCDIRHHGDRAVEARAEFSHGFTDKLCHCPG